MPALIGLLLTGSVSVYALGTLSASVPRWIVIYLWAVLALWHMAIQWVRWDEVDKLAALVVGWCALSLSWGVDRQQGLYGFSNLLALFIIFVWLRHAPKKWLSWIPETSLVCILIALAMQYVWPLDWGGHGNRNFQTEAMLVLMALALTAKRKWTWAAFVPICAVTWWYLLTINPSHSEWLIGPLALIYGIYKWASCSSWRSCWRLRLFSRVSCGFTKMRTTTPELG